MSVEATAWAFRQDVPSGQKFVLAVLADSCDRSGVTWRGQKGVSEVTGYTVRTVSAHMTWLEERGFIGCVHRHRPNGSRTSDYTVLGVSGERGEMRAPDPEEVPQSVVDLANRKISPVVDSSGPEPSDVVVSRKISKEDPEVMSRTSAGASNEQDSLDVGEVSRPAYSFNRKKMTKEEWAITADLLGLFNEVFGTDFGPQDKDQVSRIVGVIRSGGIKGMTRGELRTVLSNNAKAPWWGADKPDTVGVIFGPNTWSRARRCDGRLTGKNAVSAQRESVLSRLDGIIAEGETP